MCGIAGVVDWDGAASHRDALERAAGAMAHRGPDGAGFHVEGPIGLAHRRLSIIDLGGGGQPMFSEDGSIAIVFNGEIYNYKELARDLAARGHSFRTSSDTEVLLRLYEDRGDRMVADTRGMFAFAIWDARRRRLFAARDRYGEKPFVYAERGGRVYFASELRALRTLAGADLADARVDREALGAYLGLLYVPAPRTIFEGVKKLPAGHSLTLDERGLRVSRYEDVPVPGSEREAKPADLVKETRRRLEDAVRLQLRSDVPVGALLSGGLDSSVIVALMARELGTPVRTYSVGFGRADDELPHARKVAERYRTEHTEIVLTDDLAARVERALSAYSEPFGDSSAVPTVAVFDAVSRHAKVVLTGDGGDELFAGYDRYRECLRWPHVAGASSLASGIDRMSARAGPSRILGRARRAALLASRHGRDRARALVEVFGEGERHALLGGEPRPIDAALPETARSREDPDHAMFLDLGRYLPDDLMQKTDIAAMAASVESRSPMLDPELARFVVPLPWEAKQTPTEGKTLLKRVAADLLPTEILGRPKRGFGSPVEAWLAGPLGKDMEARLLAPDSFAGRELDRRCVEKVVRAVRRGRGNAHQAWALYALELWAGKHGREFG